MVLRMAAVASGTVILGLGALAAPASAGSGQPSAGHAIVAAAATPDVTFTCTSRPPTFVSSNDGTFTGQGINIHTGPYVGCTPKGLGYEGNTLKVWCFYINSNNVEWVYLNDRTTGVRGWSSAQFVTWSGLIPPCT